MAISTIDESQRKAAKVAGFLYLATMVIQLLADLYLRAPLIVHSDAVQTAKNIVASERLFRLSIVSGLMTVGGEIILLVALYIVLKPINRNLALLAAFWRLAKCVMFAVTALTDFVALRLLSGADYLRAFETKQLQALAGLFISARHDGGFIGAVSGTGVDRLRLLVVEVALHPSSTRRLGNRLVIGTGNRHFGHHGLPRFGVRRGTGLLGADFYLRSHSRLMAVG